MSATRPDNIAQSLRLQGQVYCALALLAMAVTPFLGNAPSTGGLVLLAITLLLLGIPHGALDTVFARRLYGVTNWWQWAVFAVAYLVPAGLVVLLWLLAPAAFLPAFLLLSVLHFSGDPAHGVPIGCRIVYGGAIIVLPTVLHAGAVQELFDLLVSGDVTADLVQLLHITGWGWLGATVIAVLYMARSQRSASLELAATGALAMIATPLVAFTVFFCVMHSPRHILNTASADGASPLRLLLRSASLPTIACIVAFGAAMTWRTGVTLDARVMQSLFVGLAALTVPHMLLVDGERWRARGLH